MRVAPTIAAGLSLSLVAAACGAESDVERAVSDVSAAMAERDGERVCDSLTEDGQGIVIGFRTPPVTCPQTVEALDADAVQGCREIEVRDVRVYSDFGALSRAVAPQGETRVGLVNIDGRWKLRTPPCGPRILE